jgi:hypothetical protein
VIIVAAMAKTYSSAGKNVQLQSVYVYIGVCGGGTFWLQNETLTFKGPAA